MKTSEKHNAKIWRGLMLFMTCPFVAALMGGAFGVAGAQATVVVFLFVLLASSVWPS